MRRARLIETGEAYYHVMSRVVDRQFVLNDDEKERFRKLLRRVEAFSGVDVLTYASLGNHVHALLCVPEREDISDAEWIKRVKALYTKPQALDIIDHFTRLREQGYEDAALAYRQRFTDRMYDLSEFVKTLKQRFTQSYNRRHGRKGTLWEERYKSILVEGSQHALSTIAAYIDLNAVRAGLVEDPGQYRYCGYGEAVGGSRQARRGLQRVMQSEDQSGAWSSVHAAYRKLVYSEGQARGVSETGGPTKPGFGEKQVDAVLKANGKLTGQQALHCRVRYLSDGLVLGSRAYVDDIFHRHRRRFSAKRQTGARPMRWVDFGGLCTARRLQLDVISISP